MNNIKKITAIKFGVVCTVALFLLWGCASGALQTTTPMEVKLANYKTIVLNVSSPIFGANEEIAQFETMAVAKLQSKNLFEKVIAGSSSPDAQSDLRLDAKIVELKKVSSAERVMQGAFAGRAGITVDTELIDVKAGTKIGAFRAHGVSSGGTRFAGTTRQAIDQATDQIVEFVQKNM